MALYISGNASKERIYSFSSGIEKMVIDLWKSKHMVKKCLKRDK